MKKNDEIQHKKRIALLIYLEDSPLQKAAELLSHHARACGTLHVEGSCPEAIHTLCHKRGHTRQLCPTAVTGQNPEALTLMCQSQELSQKSAESHESRESTESKQKRTKYCFLS